MFEWIYKKWNKLPVACILVIEDSKTDGAFLWKILQKESVHVLMAENG